MKNLSECFRVIKNRRGIAAVIIAQRPSSCGFGGLAIDLNIAWSTSSKCNDAGPGARFSYYNDGTSRIQPQPNAIMRIQIGESPDVHWTGATMEISRGPRVLPPVPSPRRIPLYCQSLDTSADGKIQLYQCHRGETREEKLQLLAGFGFKISSSLQAIAISVLQNPCLHEDQPIAVCKQSILSRRI
jgi:hypothetical protein